MWRRGSRRSRTRRTSCSRRRSCCGRSIDQYDASRPFTPWACRFALNVSRQWMARQQRWKALLDGELAEELAHRREELRPIFRLAALPLAHLAPRQAEYRTEPQMNRLTRAGPTVLSSEFVLVFERFQKLFGSMHLQPARPVRHGASRYGRRATGRGSRIRP